MNKQVKRLAPLLMLAKQKEEQRVLCFKQARVQAEREEKRLVQLSEYHAEYRMDLHRRGYDGLSSLQLSQMYKFIQQLQHLVNQQKIVLHNANAMVEKTKNEWKNEYGKKKMLETLIEKLETAQAARDTKREQMQVDEFVNRRAASEAQKKL